MLYNNMLQFEYYYKKPYFYKKAKRAKRQKVNLHTPPKCHIRVRIPCSLWDRCLSVFYLVQVLSLRLLRQALHIK